MKKVDLDVSWSRPMITDESLELVVYRLRVDPFKSISATIEEVAERGELVYRTVDFIPEEYMFVDPQLGRGEWYYAVFAKNKAGLSPGEIKSYLLADVFLKVNNFDYKTFSPGILSFDIEIGGSDASRWRWKINDEDYSDKSIEDTNVSSQIDLPIGQEHSVTIESINEENYTTATREIYFTVYIIDIKFITHPLLARPDQQVNGIQDTIVPLSAQDIRGHYFERWERSGFGIIANELINETTFRVLNQDASINGVYGLIDYNISIGFKILEFPGRTNIDGGVDEDVQIKYSKIGSLENSNGVYNIFDLLNLKFDVAEGYEFKSWEITEGNGEIGDLNNSNTVYQVDNSDSKINAIIGPVAYSLEVSGDPGRFDKTGRVLDFAETGEGVYFIDSIVNISAVANPGYKFIRWSLQDGAGSIDDMTIANTFFTLSASSAIVFAIYDPIDYRVTVANGLNGSAISSRTAFPNNIYQTHTLTGTSDAGWEFDHWELSGSGSFSANANQNSNPAVFTVGAGDCTITPIRRKKPLQLSTAGNGGVEEILNKNGIEIPARPHSITVNYKDSITIRAVPEAGSSFLNWTSSETLDSFPNPNNAQTVFSMGSVSTSMNAIYELIEYRIDIVAASNGVVVDNSGNYVKGTLVALNASPNVNYGFKNWSITGGIQGSIADQNSKDTTYTVGLAPATITANFEFTGRMQSITGTTGYQAFTELEFRWVRSAWDTLFIQDNPPTGATTYTYEISADINFNKLAVPSKVFTIFQSTVIFGDLTAYTRYYCRCLATGLPQSAVQGISNVVEFVTNPCGNYSTTVNPDGSIQIVGAEPNSGVTISEKTGNTETRGLVRPIADDEEGKLFIAEGSGQVRSQGSDPGGRLVFDGGFPKFYNSTWNSIKAPIISGAKSIYDPSIPAQFPYFYNAINHVEREEASNKKLLYINDAPGGNYTAHVFHQTVGDIARLAGFTPQSIGSETAATHSSFLQTLHTTRSSWSTYLSQYDVIVWLGTNYTVGAYIPDAMIQGLLDYFDRGGGLFVITDHNVFHNCVNQFLPYYGVKFTNNLNRTAGKDAYKISSILANQNYIPTGYHPLFANIDPNGFIAAGASEGEIVYDTSVSSTSNYTTDNNGNLTIAKHNDGSNLSGGKTFIRTASDCGEVL